MLSHQGNNKTSLKCIGDAFRSWHYSTTTASLSASLDSHLKLGPRDKDVYLDTSCTPTVVDRTFLNEQAPDAEVKTLGDTLTINGICSDKYQAKEFVRLFFCFKATVSGEDMVVAIPVEAYVVESLRANLLGMDTFGHYKFDHLLSAKRAYARIQSCSGVKIIL